MGGLGDRGIEGGPVILLSPPLPLWLFSGFSVCTSASNTLPLLFSSSGELSNSDPFKVSEWGLPLLGSLSFSLLWVGWDLDKWGSEC